MPYRRNYKKRAYRRRPVKKNYVKKIVKTELAKEIETKTVYDATTMSVGTGLSTQAFNGGAITQGTGRSQRIGNKIMTKSIRITGKLVLASADQLSRCRLMLIRTVGSGYTPVLSDLVYNDTSTYAVVSPVNEVERVGKYQILYDKRFVLDDVIGDSKDFTIYKKLNKPAYFDDGGNDLKGRIYLCAWGDDGTYNISVVFGAITKFTDA